MRHNVENVGLDLIDWYVSEAKRVPSETDLRFIQKSTKATIKLSIELNMMHETTYDAIVDEKKVSNRYAVRQTSI